MEKLYIDENINVSTKSQMKNRPESQKNKLFLSNWFQLTRKTK